MKLFVRIVLITLFMLSGAHGGGSLIDIFPTKTPVPTPIATPTPAILNIMNIMECLKFPPGTYIIVITPQTPSPTIIKH
jgi:hypothetical protein